MIIDTDKLGAWLWFYTKKAVWPVVAVAALGVATYFYFERPVRVVERTVEKTIIQPAPASTPAPAIASPARPIAQPNAQAAVDEKCGYLLGSYYSNVAGGRCLPNKGPCPLGGVWVGQINKCVDGDAELKQLTLQLAPQLKASCEHNSGEWSVDACLFGPQQRTSVDPHDCSYLPNSHWNSRYGVCVPNVQQ
jgi:hypothetical protein